MNQEQLDKLSELSQRTNKLSEELQDWMRQGRKIKDEVAGINTALLQEFRDEVSR